MSDSTTFRGVIHRAASIDDSRLALAVGHPHPDNDHGGGPGPVSCWREPYRDGVYHDLVDLGGDDDEDDADDDAGDVVDDSMFDDVSWELRTIDHVALVGPDLTEVPLIPMPHEGSIDQLRRIDDRTLGALVTWGGSLYYVASIDVATGELTARSLAGQPDGLIEIRATLAGARVLLLATTRDGTLAGLAEPDGTVLRWVQTLGSLPEDITAFDACVTDDGRLIAYVGGSQLWHWSGDAWVSVHDVSTGGYAHVTCSPSGEVIAGTRRGDVIAGLGAACRRIASPGGAIHSAVRFGAAIYVADEERVYRIPDDGGSAVACFTPPVPSIGSWPSAGELVATATHIHLAGAHSLASSMDGITWTLRPIGEPERVYDSDDSDDGDADADADGDDPPS